MLSNQLETKSLIYHNFLKLNYTHIKFALRWPNYVMTRFGPVQAFLQATQKQYSQIQSQKRYLPSMKPKLSDNYFFNNLFSKISNDRNFQIHNDFFIAGHLAQNYFQWQLNNDI